MKKTIVVIVLSYVCSCTGGSQPRITLAWDPNQERSVVGYNVYRSETSGCCYTKINKDPVSQPEYTDTAVKAGKRYYYRVTAVNSRKSAACPSEQGSAARVSANSAASSR